MSNIIYLRVIVGITSVAGIYCASSIFFEDEISHTMIIRSGWIIIVCSLMGLNHFLMEMLELLKDDDDEPPSESPDLDAEPVVIRDDPIRFAFQNPCYLPVVRKEVK